MHRNLKILISAFAISAVAVVSLPVEGSCGQAGMKQGPGWMILAENNDFEEAEKYINQKDEGEVSRHNAKREKDQQGYNPRRPTRPIYEQKAHT